MKAWILAAVVAGVLIVVGVPAVALTVASHDRGSDRSTASASQHHHAKGPGAAHRFGKPGRGFGGHGMRPGPGFGLRPGHGRHPFTMKKLSSTQRHALARKLDQRAAQLRKTATCLRQKSDASKCLKQFFRPSGFSPPRQQG